MHAPKNRAEGNNARMKKVNMCALRGGNAALMEPTIFETEFAGRRLTIEVGKYANQANGAALVRYGDTAVMATATASDEPKDLGFFPLTVNYEKGFMLWVRFPVVLLNGRDDPRKRLSWPVD